MGIKFINTDLNLKDPAPPLELITALEKNGLVPLGDPREFDGLWFVALEIYARRVTLETTVDKILKAIEGLDEKGRVLWDQCQTREIDIGYESNSNVRETTIGLKPEVLRRIAETGATLKFTVYH